MECHTYYGLSDLTSWFCGSNTTNTTTWSTVDSGHMALNTNTPVSP